jgi:endonuclease/exonuclease/phosphatase family metal-dependent hydrolase
MMWRWVAATLALCGVLTGCAGYGALPAARTTPADTLRVMTYNIFAGNDLDRHSNLVRVAALIDSLRADVVFLQEVDRRTARSGGVDQAGVLAERTGMQAVFGRAMEFDGGEYGIAVLSRRPIRSSRVVPLEVARPSELTARPYEPRALLHVVIDTRAGQLHLLNTHLDHQGDPVFRHPQVLQLLAYAADSVPRGAATVLGGDLNAVPEATEVRALGVAFDDAWTRCGSGAGPTFRADRPVRRIDYILLAGTRCVAARIIDTLLSDHRPLVVDLLLGGG